MTPVIFLRLLKSAIERDRYKLLNDFMSRHVENKDILEKITFINPSNIISYLSNYSSDELNSIYKEYKSLSFNQKNLFLNAIEYSSIYHKDKTKSDFKLHSLEREIWRIKKGMLNTNLKFIKSEGYCYKTIIGFIRAFKEDTIFTTKVKIDGKLTRVFIKTEIGTSKDSNLNFGSNVLLLDPKTLNVYNFDGYKSSLNLKQMIKLNLKSSDYLVSLKNLSSEKFTVSILNNEISAYINRYKERMGFSKMNLKPIASEAKKKSLFSKIRQKVLKK